MPMSLTCLLLVIAQPSATPDLARLRELLHDPQNPREQSQAALLLVRDASPEAEEIVRRGLRELESPDVFLALSAAVRVDRDARFADELLAALGGTPASPRLAVRQAAAEALASCANDALITRLEKRLADAKTEPVVRQAVMWVLGRSGHQRAAGLLVGQLGSDQQVVQRGAVEALTELTGLHFGNDRVRWESWWKQNKDLSRERWLELRLGYQSSRARRLESELERTRSQLVRAHQLLYNRLPAAERVGHIQALADQDDPAVRQLVVLWSAELLSNQSANTRGLGEVLLRLSHDSHSEVQRMAVLALGRSSSKASFERLLVLFADGRPALRAAAARSLSQLARGTDAEAMARRKQVVPLLQQALRDSALEVVVEAAEDLGVLGVPEAGPALIQLLKHPSESVRKTAAHALESVAGPALLTELLAAVGDTSVAVRFGLVGAIGRAVGDGVALTEKQREELLEKLQAILVKDSDASVRSRAASVLGECGSSAVLVVLWQRFAAGEDPRVQEKALAALVEIIVRAGKEELLKEWDATLSKAGQANARLSLLTEAHTRWQARADAKTRFLTTAPLLTLAKLEQGRWQAALPLLRELLGRSDDPTIREQALRCCILAAEQALRAGDTTQARRILDDMRPFLPKDGKLVESFKDLERRVNERGS